MKPFHIPFVMQYRFVHDRNSSNLEESLTISSDQMSTKEKTTMLCPRFTIGLDWMGFPEKKHQSREILVARQGVLFVNNNPIKNLFF